MLPIVYWNALKLKWGGLKEGQFIKVNSFQAWDDDYWSNMVIALWPGFIKDRYPTEAWIVRHRWPIELMAQWIWWVSSSWNIGIDWSPIVIECRLSYNRPRLWVLPMYRSSSTFQKQIVEHTELTVMGPGLPATKWHQCFTFVSPSCPLRLAFLMRLR